MSTRIATSLGSICLFTVIFHGCLQAPSEGITVSQSAPHQVVLIFQKPPVNSVIEKDGGKFGRGDYEIFYLDDQQLPQHYSFKNETSDTLIIETDRSMIEIQHAYLGVDRLSYLVSKGDSILFKYDSLRPFAQRLNKDKLSIRHSDLNYDLLRRDSVSKGDYPAYVKLRAFPSFLSFAKPVPVAFKELFQVVKSDSRDEYFAELTFLTSLHQRKKISDRNFNFYKAKSRVEFLKVQEDTTNVYLIQEPLNNLMHDKALNLCLSADSLKYYPFYHDLVEWCYQIEGRRVKRKIDETSNAPDYEQIYQNVLSDNNISDGLKKALMLKAAEDIIQHSSVATINSFSKRFNSEINDSSYASYLQRMFRLEDNVSASLNLMTLTKEKLSFENVLARHKGKVIYLDFWASWCGPCIQAFSDSRKLENKLVNREIVFVYISQDIAFDKWHNAVGKHKIGDSANHFIIENKSSSRYLEDMGIKTIPRYFIFDKNGVLIDKDAPGPSSLETEKKLLELAG